MIPLPLVSCAAFLHACVQKTQKFYSSVIRADYSGADFFFARLLSPVFAPEMG